MLDVLPLEVDVLRADGGATANRFLMQFQADLIGSPVEVAADADATAMGAAMLAGLAVGTWSGTDELASLIRRGRAIRAADERSTRSNACAANGTMAVRRALL